MTDQDTGPTMGAPGGYLAVVTGADLLARFDHLAEGLTAIKTIVSPLPAQLVTLEARMERNAADIAALQRWRAFWTGATTVLALMLASGLAVALVRGFTHTH